MGLISWMNKKGKKLNVWDIGFVKGASVFFGIIIGAYISSFVKQYIVVFIVISVLFSIKPLYDAYLK